ncbi:hypothetical protein SHKM778_53990 [Streptomyces sp. KM77-8]|uniref:HTH tetR-type domain-containing protein n=1 Tax=Streptomyces haneummycinicus TaxID=3074435 RepID=A0AAT9HNU2_9ACTN
MLYAGFMSAAPPPAPAPQGPVQPQELPQLGTDPDEPCLRADAARNRARLLEAAALLVAERGPDGVTMEEVAAAARVGKGTVFRRFGDRTGLLTALLDHSEKKFQAAFLSGPPPLGPGAPRPSGCAPSASRCSAAPPRSWNCSSRPNRKPAAASPARPGVSCATM